MEDRTASRQIKPVVRPFHMGPLVIGLRDDPDDRTVAAGRHAGRIEGIFFRGAQQQPYDVGLVGIEGERLLQRAVFGILAGSVDDDVIVVDILRLMILDNIAAERLY